MTTISQKEDLTRPVEAARPAERMPLRTALASLLMRVRAARILREHHVWEAVRILPDAAGLPVETRHSPELHGLMEKDALAAALSLLAQSCQPAREFTRHDQQGDRWIATLRQTGLARKRRPVRAEHRDPAAAMLTALLLSTAAGKPRPMVSGRQLRADPQKELSND